MSSASILPFRFNQQQPAILPVTFGYNPEAALQRLEGVDARRIIGMFDYDLTLADKLDPQNPDHSPMLVQNYIMFRDFCGQIAQPIILTARGEGLRVGLFSYLGSLAKIYGRIPNLEVASNSGHYRHRTWMPRPDEFELIEIPGMSRQLAMTVTSFIHEICSTMNRDFSEITMADQRELCGAIVAQFPVDKQFEAANGELTSHRYQQYLQRAEELRKSLPDNFGDLINFPSKYWTEDHAGNKLGSGADAAARYITKGYTDMLIKGMSKGVTAPIIYQDYAKKINGKPFLIVGGDSTADYDMFVALKDMVPPENRLFIAVGDGLIKTDTEYAAANNNERLIDIVLADKTPEEKITAVDNMHILLDAIGKRPVNKAPEVPFLRIHR